MSRALIAMLAVLVLPATAEAREQTRCLPLGGLLVAKVIRDGNEVTERLGNGVYRVTRCRDDGTIKIEMTVAPVRDPDGLRIKAPAMIVKDQRIRLIDRGDPNDPRWAKVWRRVRERVRDSILPQTDGEPIFEPTALAASGSECNDKKFTETGSFWADTGYHWRWHAKSFGSNADTLESLKKAHAAWDNSKNNCDLGDKTKFKSVYDGTTSSRVGRDLVSVVDKGSLKEVGCEGALACVQVFYGFEGRANEVDVRFGDQFKWSNGGADGKFDYRSVATHEFGHALGLSDLYDNPNLTMSYQITEGTTGARTLGRGDILGLRALYP